MHKLSFYIMSGRSDVNLVMMNADLSMPGKLYVETTTLELEYDKIPDIQKTIEYVRKLLEDSNQTVALIICNEQPNFFYRDPSLEIVSDGLKFTFIDKILENKKCINIYELLSRTR